MKVPLYFQIPTGLRGNGAKTRRVPPADPTTISNRSSITLAPTDAITSTSTGAPNPALEGTKLANPLASLATVLCETDKITGIAGFPGSPPFP